MRLKSSKSKGSESFSIIGDFVDPVSKKRSTYVVEALGNLSFWMEKLNTDSRDVVVAHLKQLIKERNAKTKEELGDITLSLSQTKEIPAGQERCFNIGYSFLMNILYSLGLKTICSEISSRYQFKYNLEKILCHEVCSRIISPGSKKADFENKAHLFNSPDFDLQHLYRSLPVLAKERYTIESSLYSALSKSFGVNKKVLFFDCTNFYFEIEEEDTDGLRKYGKSKEHRPNPIVQYGLFMDGSGIPLCDICFEGNKNEQESLRSLEKIIDSDFGGGQFIVCADAGLNGWANKIYNDKKDNRAYIVTQPVRKLNKTLKEWAVDPQGWHLPECPGVQFDIRNLKGSETVNINGTAIPTDKLVFYKDRWTKTKKKDPETGNSYELEEHLIVSFSTKYQKYQKRIRDAKIERAESLLKNPGRITTKDERNPRYFIKQITVTENGEVADDTEYSIDEEKVAELEKYDGFYAVCTDLEDKCIDEILKINRNRWESEESFEIMKSNLKTRPMYVTREEAIKGHLLICFMALQVYRILEHLLESRYTIEPTINTLRKLNVTYLGGTTYVPAFKKTPLVEDLQNLFGYSISYEALTEKYLKQILRKSKPSKVRKIGN